MKDRSQHFSYTAQAASYTAMAVALAMLGLVEGALYAALLLLLTDGATGVVGLAVGLILFAYALLLLFSPLFTRHGLSPEGLTLHVGLGFKATIDRKEIASVEATDRRLPSFPGRIAYDKAQDVLVAAVSAKGLILMQLIRPHVFKMWPLQRCETSQVLFNVDEPEAFLRAVDTKLVEAVKHLTASLVAPVIPALRTVQLDDGPVKIRRLTKFYGQHIGVEDLNLTVARGEIYGLLGVNGAGKTTTLKMLVGLMQPTQGRVELCGLDIQQEPVRAKAHLGYLAETTIVYEKLTGREFLEFMAELQRVDERSATSRVRQLLMDHDLVDWADQMIRVYSFGMRRKIALAGAVIHQPAVLVLDEPFKGLDPRSSRHVKNHLRQARHEGTAILLSTHNLAIAEELCDRIGIIDRGHLIAEGTAPELRHRAQMEGSSLEDVFLRLTTETGETAGMSDPWKDGSP